MKTGRKAGKLSEYKSNKKRGGRVEGYSHGKCSYCGGKCGRSIEERKCSCKAWDKKCHECHKIGHFSSQCRAKDSKENKEIPRATKKDSSKSGKVATAK